MVLHATLGAGAESDRDVLTSDCPDSGPIEWSIRL
jgi:hypothetical protein